MNNVTGDGVARAMVVFAVVVVTAIGLAVTVASLQAPDAGEQMLAVSPGGEVEPQELEPELRQLYQDVAADPAAFEQVRCYCGCEAMLDHRHLRDCFERPQGGWERHAVGCGVCQQEARDVLAGRAAGLSMDEIITEIDQTYAGITEETP